MGGGECAVLSWSTVQRRWRRRRSQWQAWSRMARRLAPFATRRKGRLGLALLLGVGYSLAGLAEPWTLKLILDNVLLGRSLPDGISRVLGSGAEHRVLLLNLLVIAIILLAVARGWFYYMQRLIAARVGQQAAADMRLELYRHLQSLSFRFHDRRRTGDMIARLTGDIRFLRQIFISLPLSIASEILLVVGMIAVMMAMDWTLTLLALLSIPVLVIMLEAYQRPMRQAMRRQRDREGDLATIANEVLGAIRVVQGFRREKQEVDRFTVQNKRSLRTGLKAARLEAKMRWYAEITVAVVTALVIGVAARRVLTGSLTPGDLLVFVAYLRAFSRPLRRVSKMAERSARGVAAGERVMEMLEIEPAVQDLPGAVRARRIRGAVTLEDIVFRYDRGGDVLKNVSLDVRPGERIALIGPTGAGKSSLVSLIPRFYDVGSGAVKVDGRDVREYTVSSLRDQIALVFQEPFLFATSIAENITYGRPGATREEIVGIAERVGIHDVIDALPEGYDTVIGERGGTLSGGQRQCVAIARAFMKDAPIVILDEPLVGLDGRAAALVIEALHRLMEGRTALIVTHQLESIRDLDRIVLLDGGRIVDEGSHEDLYRRNALYRSFHVMSEEGLVR